MSFLFFSTSFQENSILRLSGKPNKLFFRDSHDQTLSNQKFETLRLYILDITNVMRSHLNNDHNNLSAGNVLFFKLGGGSCEQIVISIFLNLSSVFYGQFFQNFCAV